MKKPRTKFTGPSKLPPGPHKNWAIFLRDTLEELGWSRRQTCQCLKVEIGWLKKALKGEDLDGAYRLPFEVKLRSAWDEYRKDRPQLTALEWPPYVENTPKDATRPIASIEKISLFHDAMDLVQDQLWKFQSAMESIDLLPDDTASAELREQPQTAFEKSLLEVVNFWAFQKDASLRVGFRLVVKSVFAKKFEKAGRGFFALGEKLIHQSKGNEQKYREYAFYALEIYWLGTILLIAYNCHSQVIKLIKRQIANATLNGDLLIVARLQLLLSVAYDYLDQKTNERYTKRYTALGLASARSALTHLSASVFPSHWATAQVCVGSNLIKQANLCEGKAALDTLQEAEKALQLALRKSELGDPNFCNVSWLMGEIFFARIGTFTRHGDNHEEEQALKEATLFLKRSIGNISPVEFPREWAALQYSYGKVLLFSLSSLFRVRPRSAVVISQMVKLISKSIEAFKYGIGVLEPSEVEDDKLLKEIIYHVMMAKGMRDALKSDDTSLLKVLMGRGKANDTEPLKTVVI